MATQQNSTEPAKRASAAHSSGDKPAATNDKTSTDAGKAKVRTAAAPEASVLPATAMHRRVSSPRTAPNPVAETVTFSIDLPAHVHVAPEHEAAVAIDDVPLSPAIIEPADPTTTTVIQVVATIEAPAMTAQAAADGLVPAVPEGPREIVPLPGDEPQLREPVAHEPVAATTGEVKVPETASMLTEARLVNSRKKRRPAPEGFWPELIYTASAHLINIGDSVRVRERKALDARIAKQFEGGTRFIPVMTRKGGVGKTTVTTLLGMALSTVRDDRVIAIDANPDRGTLAERVHKTTRSTVRDLVTNVNQINGFTDLSTFVSRDETRLDILASDSDPLLAQAFDDYDYNVVADQAAKYYSVVLTDCGTGIVHPVMRATLARADEVVIVSGGSVDEARLASETLTWLESNGYEALVRNAVVAINTATHATTLVKLEEIEAHFNSRVRAVIRMPYDPHLAAGAVIDYKDLKPLTRNSARDLAALVMDGLPVRRPN